MAQALGKRARQALALGSDRSGEIGRQLEDDLLAAMDRPVIDAIGGLAARFGEGNMDDNAIDAELRGRARRTALTLFDTVFPVIGGDTPSIKVAKVRRELVRDLYRLAPQRHAGGAAREAAA